MATTFGQIQEFSPEIKPVEAYIERVELYFEANNIGTDQHVAVFLCDLREELYPFVQLLVSIEAQCQDIGWTDGCSQKAKEWLLQSISNCTAGSGQSEKVSYKAKLRYLATYCDFGEYLDQALRDRLACRLRSEAMQKHLLSKSDLTLKRELEIAQSQEAAARNMQQLKEGDASTFSVESVALSNRKLGCYRCGGRNHLS